MPRFNSLAIGITSLIVVGLAGATISLSASLESACEPLALPGKASSLVTAMDGDEGTPTLAEFPNPLVTVGAERSVLREGSGYEATVGSAVDFQVAAYLGSDSSLLTSSSYIPDQPIRRVIGAEDGDYFSSALQCAKPGDRLVVTDTIEAIFGPITEDEIVQNSSTTVLVIDVVNTYPAQAEGARQGLVDQAPMIVQHPSGRHGVSIPMGTPPDELVVYTVKKGSGPALSDGDMVVTHYTGVVWETAQAFSTSFDMAAPVSLTLVNGAGTDGNSGVISGIHKALVGQTVGSQVAVVVPPSEGYPPGMAPAGVPDGATLIYVFDILGIQ